MTVEIRKAERTKAKLRLGLVGPSGARKTMSSLKLAKGLTPTGRLLMIDTERGSGDLYADLFDYDIITLQPPYKPEKYVEAIRAGEEAGYDKPSSSTAYRTPGATKAAYSTRLRIPVMTTMRSGAWRPLDPVDEDHGGA